jgi:hypothetical protein
VVCYGRAAFAALLAVASASGVRAQDRQPPTPPPAVEQPPEEESVMQKYLGRIPEPDQGGGFHFAKHLAVVFGGIKPGSGIALGPAVSYTFADGAYAQIKGVYSIRNFSVLQGRYDTRSFWRRRATLVTRMRWQNAPELDLYALGPDSPRAHGRYGEEKTEVRTQLELRVSRNMRVAAGYGFERYVLSNAFIEAGEDHPLQSIPSVPGLSSRPSFTHDFISCVRDTRKTEYGRSGRVIDATLDQYHDWRNGLYSFQKFEGGVRQLVPVFSRDAVDLSGRIWSSTAGAGHAVPFFLMPTLGGGDYLEAFNLYRFRDRNAVWLNAEYRHAIRPALDVAGFYEAGVVGPSFRAMSAGRAARTVGGGVLVHTKTATIVRADVAHGREGYSFAVLLTAAGL